MAAALTVGLGIRRPSVIPGFGPALGVTLVYLSLIVLIPLAAMFLRTASLSWAEFWHIATDARVLAALRLSFGAAFAAAWSTPAAARQAWVLVRSFPFASARRRRICCSARRLALVSWSPKSFRKAPARSLPPRVATEAGWGVTHRVSR
jgi:hypothetical protein